MSDRRLAGKTAVITGASGGIGRVACRLFCEEGATLVGTDVAEAPGHRLEQELRADGLDSCPGVIDTPMPHQALAGLPEPTRSAIFAGWEASHVAGRIGRPTEVAALALFLASDEATFITGAAIPVDSGVTAR